MLPQIHSQSQLPAKSSNYYDGEFDAAIGLPPKTYWGDYWRGYLNKTLETGNTPF
ncbi:hypothetical protein [Nostoc sp. FACHB-190]|uniref:hypothetical protein n=1 Tax=Nostoc sp. FACHB-190 TaxID=2692838 RepID=UPI001688A919|nr:hypothetical protein [Nostoc sp. FACHB-190]MBD2303444.1 hypothetical protein [Nostoc sp. FACHB-190]